MSLSTLTFNPSLEEIHALRSGAADAFGRMETLLAGAVIEEYDAQIQAHTSELTALNGYKAAVRGDKLQATTWLSRAEFLDGAGFTIKDEQGHIVPFKDEAFAMNSAELSRLESLAQSYAVNLGTLPTNGEKMAVPVKVLESLKEAMDNRLQDLNSQSEMKMIQFQSLMDARKQTLMMLSNMIHSDNQNKLAVIQNMKN